MWSLEGGFLRMAYWCGAGRGVDVTGAAGGAGDTRL